MLILLVEFCVCSAENQIFLNDCALKVASNNQHALL